MVILSSIYLEARLILFVRDAISHSCAKHHLGTLHKVPHYVFKFRKKCLFVDQVKVNFILGCDLDPNISSNEKYLPSHFIKLMI